MSSKYNMLAESFSKSIKGPVTTVLQNLGEVGLDNLIDNEMLKSIPFISTAVSVYGIGKSVSELHHLKQLMRFIETTNAIINGEEREKIIKEFNSKSVKERNKELEYIILLSSKYLNENKPELLSKLYVSYLNGYVDWTQFIAYSEVIDRLLPNDIDCLITGNHCDIADNEVSDSMLRMVSLGLYRGVNNPSYDNKDYVLTKFGNTFRWALELYTREWQNYLLSKTIEEMNKRSLSKEEIMKIAKKVNECYWNT